MDTEQNQQDSNTAEQSPLPETSQEDTATLPNETEVLSSENKPKLELVPQPTAIEKENDKVPSPAASYQPSLVDDLKKFWKKAVPR